MVQQLVHCYLRTPSWFWIAQISLLTLRLLEQIDRFVAHHSKLVRDNSRYDLDNSVVYSELILLRLDKNWSVRGPIGAICNTLKAIINDSWLIQIHVRETEVFY